MFTLIRLFVIVFQALRQSGRYLLGRAFHWILAPFTSQAVRLERRRRLQASCLTAFLRDLGGTFVKIGQILSSRPDVLPDHVIAELSTLQDHVPPFAFERVREVLEQDLGRPLEQVYAHFEKEPVAAASIAQVHEARLEAGQRVAVKVQRPDIAVKIERDLRIIRSAARALDVLPPLRAWALPKLAAEFARAISAQLDFPLEIANNRRFARGFANVPWLYLPEIFDDKSGRRVITMSFVDGKKLTEVLDDPPLPREILAERIFEMYLKMAFELFFLHADLHPGNILVDRDGNFVLLDTGLVSEIPAHYVRKFFRVALAFTTLDGRLVGEAYLEGCEMTDQQRALALGDMEKLGERFRSAATSKSNAFVEADLAGAISEIMALMRRHKIRMDPEWTGLMLSDVTFEGIAKMLDEHIDFTGLLARSLPGTLAATEVVSSSDQVVQAVLGAGLVAAATA